MVLSPGSASKLSKASAIERALDDGGGSVALAGSSGAGQDCGYTQR